MATKFEIRPSGNILYVEAEAFDESLQEVINGCPYQGFQISFEENFAYQGARRIQGRMPLRGQYAG